jgi:hypothetical protein
VDGRKEVEAMTRPRITEWPYADPDQQDDPVPDVPLMAALVAVVWWLRWWIGIVIAGALLALGVVYGAWRMG